jgi:hypothetical protein
VVLLAVGTNNSVSLGVAKGQAFAQTVLSVSKFATSNAGGHVDVYGANDIETFATANGYQVPSNTYSWYTGYSDESPPPYENYGSADGCPLVVGGTCSDTWNEGDYYNLSWGYTLAEVTPEIYYPPSNGNNAAQWEYISKTGAGTGAIVPLGPMDEHDLAAGTNTSAQAWSQLNQYFPSMTYSLEEHDAT